MGDDVSAWFFQAHPEVWDVGRFLADVRDGRTTPATTWHVPKRQREVFEGDRVFLWVSGPENDAGVYALARVDSTVEDRPDDKPEYAMPGHREEFLKVLPRAVIHVESRLVPHLSRRRLKRVPGLEDHRLITGKGPQGTIFEVRLAEERILEQLCAERVES